MTTTMCRWCHIPGEPQGESFGEMLYRCIDCGSRWFPDWPKPPKPAPEQGAYVSTSSVAIARAIDAPRRRR